MTQRFDFPAFFQATASPLAAYLRRMGATQAVAEDAVQDAFEGLFHDVSPGLAYSCSNWPEPPISAGTSFCFGRPSRISMRRRMISRDSRNYIQAVIVEPTQ